jgi:phytol kinase
VLGEEALVMVAWFGTIEPLWEKVAIVALWLALVGIAAVLTDRISPRGSEYVRKVVHIGTGNIILLAWWMQIPAWVGVSAGVFFSGVTLLSYRFELLPSIHNVGRKSFGTFFYAVSIAVLVGWFWTIDRPEFGVLGILVMTWGDGLAGLIGKQFGCNHYEIWGMKKSWEGSATMAIVSSFVCFLVLSNSIEFSSTIVVISVGIGIISALLEAFSKFGLDNLTVPIVSAAIAYGLSQVYL